MSRKVCTNRSSIVLMSFEKKPMDRSSWHRGVVDFAMMGRGTRVMRRAPSPCQPDSHAFVPELAREIGGNTCARTVFSRWWAAGERKKDASQGCDAHFSSQSRP